MEKVYIPLLFLFLFISGCFVSKEYPVEYDYNFLGDFDDYKSFDFFMFETYLPEAPKKLVKSTIKSHLELLGYKYDPENPSFYVSYFYINDSLKYKGYDQPRMESFVKYRSDTQKEKEKYLEKKLNIDKGTLVINFTETDDYSMIWQGYTTDLYSENIFDDPRKIRVAVLSILNNYSYVPQRKNN
ncbi:DUF4136 domain-containing protein [Marivirga arenosa]|uniref:DUF4136 domain-containing protein n=1 Tax=Marivirga arenosa TaxID=3059076 RepID=A0AA49JAU6_9BACT|nr:DUF4136 domain-containing protein [Marivirga sp. ABR2-2]WKK84627.2 DUF4136 domain-containing protein [Marivirga sp. ABR2-2]